MKAKILFLIIICFSVLASHAQRWMPVGTVFTQSKIKMHPSGWYPIGLKPEIIEVIDTVRLNGKLCTYTDISGKILDTSSVNGSFITYQDSGVVYWYRPYLRDFTVLYDFNKNVGEGWMMDGLPEYMGGPKYCSRPVIVTSKKIVTINGFDLIQITLQYEDAKMEIFGDVIEGIGALGEPFPFHAPCFAGIVDDYSEYCGLRCVSHPDIGFHDFKIAPTCDYEPTSIKTYAKNNALKIAPNPSKGQFNIQLSNLFVDRPTIVNVLDLMGRIVLSKEVNFKNQQALINLNVSDGIYFVEMTDGNGETWRERILIQQ